MKDHMTLRDILMLEATFKSQGRSLPFDAFLESLLNQSVIKSRLNTLRHLNAVINDANEEIVKDYDKMVALHDERVREQTRK